MLFEFVLKQILGDNFEDLSTDLRGRQTDFVHLWTFYGNIIVDTNLLDLRPTLCQINE